MRRFRRLFAASLFAASPAFASGNEHVVDDAAVEKPGTCHLETWVTLSSGRSGLANASPACTRAAWPNLEIGGFVTNSWTRGQSDTVIGLAPKIALRSEDTGIGIGVATSIGYGVDRRRLENAGVIIPVTVPVGDRLRLNFNAGRQWFRLTNRNDLFVGAQAEIAMTKTLGLMVEAFTRDTDKPGGQIGLRWTPHNGSMDFDLVAGRYVDGTTHRALSLGVTLRR